MKFFLLTGNRPMMDPRFMDPRMMDPRMMDPRMMDPRMMDPRMMDPRMMGPMGGAPTPEQLNWQKMQQQWMSEKNNMDFARPKKLKSYEYVPA